MEVSAEAKRIMVVALGKLYSSRSQRGGLRLHRSLLLTLVMKSARDIYHEAQATAEGVEPGCEQQQPAAAQGNTESSCVELRGPASLRTLPREEVVAPRTEDKENRCPSVTVAAQPSRKRRGKAAAEPDFLPCKKAKLEQTSCPQQLLVSPVLMDYMNCSSLGAHPAPMPIHRAIAAC
ncbi:immediate early response gene 2 protein [Paralichthys olivaceus]|uniref:immediate early response gene 2 protein n=1 Tax=Paralichthys olivaceus TaxID=8255 RepID=UPI00097CED12|nr:PREDICTED: immediate early response gene 2 protein-like [Paralichthys olivaceus]